jgi:UDP-2,3-diacylglucosamine pyrophosphatase LpxH
LRSYDGLDFGNIKVVDEYTFDGVWCVHGDKYDAIVMNRKWLAVIGSAGYEVLLVANKANQKVRQFLGLRPRSLSKWVKNKVKGAANFISSFENMVITEGKSKSAHTVIAGHIHTAADKSIDGVRYINTGDWIENLTYVTLKDGVFELKSHQTS